MLNDLEWLFHDKIRFRSAILESECVNIRNSTTSAILRCSVQCALHDQLASLGRHAQLTRCFSAVAELLVILGLGLFSELDFCYCTLFVFRAVFSTLGLTVLHVQ